MSHRKLWLTGNSLRAEDTVTEKVYTIRCPRANHDNAARFCDITCASMMMKWNDLYKRTEVACGYCNSIIGDLTEGPEED